MRYPSPPRSASLGLLSLTLFAICAFRGTAHAGGSGRAGGIEANAVQLLVDDLRGSMKITQTVGVEIVARNPRLASVESASGGRDGFVLSLERSFLDGLNEDELRAVLAHELGHVWIFTHHPYLQTEQLANRIAMQVVSRETLERVYDKVWRDGAAKGDLAGFLGLKPVAGTAGLTNVTASRQ